VTFAAFVRFSVQFPLPDLFSVTLASPQSLRPPAPTRRLVLTFVVECEYRIVITWVRGREDIWIGRRKEE
jgi:hypothetical protein